MSDQVTWSDFSRAEFDRRKRSKGHKQAPAEQHRLFTLDVEPAKAPALPAELPGQLDMFGGES